MPPGRVSTNLRDRDVRDAFEGGADAALVAVDPADPGRCRPGPAGGRRGPAACCSRSAGRPGLRAACRAAARRLGRGRRSTSSGTASAANWTRVQTVPRLAWSRNSACGSATEARPMLASPARAPAPPAGADAGCAWSRRTGAASDFGLNLSFLQPVPWTGSETGKAEKAAGLVGSAPPPLSDPAVAILLQLVPLRVNSLRLTLTKIERMSSLAPPKTSGISATRLIWAVSGSTKSGDPDDDVAEVEGPGERRGDDHQRERRPLVGTGEVGLAADLQR